MAVPTEINKDLKIADTKPKGRVAHLAGFPAEHRLHADIRSFLPIRQRGLRSIAILKSVREPEYPSFYDTIADAVEDRLITREQEPGILDAGLITRARIKGTGETVYHHDVQRQSTMPKPSAVPPKPQLSRLSSVTPSPPKQSKQSQNMTSPPFPIPGRSLE